MTHKLNEISFTRTICQIHFTAFFGRCIFSFTLLRNEHTMADSNGTVSVPLLQFPPNPSGFNPMQQPPTLPPYLYRILRPDENPKEIVAKNPAAEKTVLSHVNCGGRPQYASQFISTSASLEVAKYYMEKGMEDGLKDLTIGKFQMDKLPQSCQFVDLTKTVKRNFFLGNAVCNNFAKASQEVLLQCDVPIPCTVIYPPPN